MLIGHFSWPIRIVFEPTNRKSEFLKPHLNNPIFLRHICIDLVNIQDCSSIFADRDTVDPDFADLYRFDHWTYTPSQEFTVRQVLNFDGPVSVRESLLANRAVLPGNLAVNLSLAYASFYIHIGQIHILFDNFLEFSMSAIGPAIFNNTEQFGCIQNDFENSTKSTWWNRISVIKQIITFVTSAVTNTPRWR